MLQPLEQVAQGWQRRCYAPQESLTYPSIAAAVLIDDWMPPSFLQLLVGFVSGVVIFGLQQEAVGERSTLKLSCLSIGESHRALEHQGETIVESTLKIRHSQGIFLPFRTRVPHRAMKRRSARRLSTKDINV